MEVFVGVTVGVLVDVDVLPGVFVQVLVGMMAGVLVELKLGEETAVTE